MDDNAAEHNMMPDVLDASSASAVSWERYESVRALPSSRHEQCHRLTLAIEAKDEVKLRTRKAMDRCCL